MTSSMAAVDGRPRALRDLRVDVYFCFVAFL